MRLYKCIDPIHPLVKDRVYIGKKYTVVGVERIDINRISHYARRFEDVTFKYYRNGL